MDLDRVRTSFEHLYGRSMEEEPGSRPILGRFFVAHVTPDWAAEVPEGRMVAAASAMSAMHCALERGDYAEALAQLKAWAGLPGVAG